MIQITLTQALALYSGILGALAIIIWLYTDITTRRRYHVLEKQFLWRCVFCGYNYLDEAAEDISKCPRCESLNVFTDKHARFIPTRPKHPEKAVHREHAPGARRNPSHRKHPHQRRRGPRRRPR